MKLGTGLLICGALLIAAAPVWGDRADYSATKGTSNNEFSAKAAGSSGVNLGSLVTSGIGAQAAYTGSVESFGVGFTPKSNWKAWSRGRGEGVIISTAIPEPGSLGLILLGLVGVGLLARRRGQQPATT